MNGTETERTPAHGRAIPSRRIAVDHPSQLPADYSSTPGGTIFSTTPGGTRIIYERKFLLELRNSPLAKTPPNNLPLIPGVTCDQNTKVPEQKPVHVEENGEKHNDLDDSNTQFEMDI